MTTCVRGSELQAERGGKTSLGVEANDICLVGVVGKAAILSTETKLPVLAQQSRQCTRSLA